MCQVLPPILRLLVMVLECVVDLAVAAAVAVAGRGGASSEEECLRAGFDATQAKPLSVKDLQKLLWEAHARACARPAESRA